MLFAGTAATGVVAGKNEAGLDHYQVRLYRAWYRYVTFAMLALACLAVTRAALADDSTILLTSANEIRRIFAALCGPPRDEQHAGHWSRWRHHHQQQQRASHFHYQRQRLKDHEVRLEYQDALRIPGVTASRT